LGLGFYESISTGTPVLTLDTPPHNEIILNGVNGWTIKCCYEKMIDNNDPLFDSAYFDINVLSNKIMEIGNQICIEEIIVKLKNDIVNRLNFDTFREKFIQSIYSE
jgi:hypothetical protein